MIPSPNNPQRKGLPASKASKQASKHPENLLRTLRDLPAGRAGPASRPASRPAPRDRRGQHTLEYLILMTLLMAGIIIGGPYVIRSWNAQMKGWEDSVVDSM
ncbi:MAG: hypothetical protein HZC18_05090, partial [Candidatus Omnitrophica bacterium]|nr:hypothetical protein [Candidatus Omnitrophota bacterium]